MLVRNCPMCGSTIYIAAFLGDGSTYRNCGCTINLDTMTYHDRDRALSIIAEVAFAAIPQGSPALPQPNAAYGIEANNLYGDICRPDQLPEDLLELMIDCANAQHRAMYPSSTLEYAS